MRKPAIGWSLALVVALTPLVGCVGFGDGDAEDRGNDPPEAQLDIRPRQGWTGDSIEFDAGDSQDPDGRIEEYRFDFGDGNSTTLRADEVRGDEDDEDDAGAPDDENNDGARVEHAYTHGGRFTTLLTVRDDGSGAGVKRTDTVESEVVVNERQPIVGSVVKTALVNDTTTSRVEHGFRTYDGADRFELNLTVEAATPVGASEVQIRVLDEDGDPVADETVTVGSGDSERVDLDGGLRSEEAYRVVVSAEEGAVTYSGELELYYAGSDGDDGVDGSGG